MYAYREKSGRIVTLAGAHVDDILWAAEPEYEGLLLNNLFSHFQVNQVEEGEFRFCGREYSQAEDFGVYVTCKHNTEKILPISFQKGTRGPDNKATASEIAQARSVVGSLA